MVIESFHPGKLRDIYDRFETRGRMLPDELKYIDSWIDVGFSRCFQLMECEDPSLLQEWISNWNDLIDFEVVPVVPSKRTKEIMACRPRVG